MTKEKPFPYGSRRRLTPELEGPPPAPDTLGRAAVAQKKPAGDKRKQVKPWSETRFTERAQAALRLAQESSAELGHGYVGSEHLLLGLSREGRGVAARVLQSAGLEARTSAQPSPGWWGWARRADDPPRASPPVQEDH